MDRPKTLYRETFERLATRNGEIIAVVSSSKGRKFGSTEKECLAGYKKASLHNACMPDDLKEGSAHLMAVDQEARAAIQAYKRRNGIPLDTPPVEDTAPPSPDEVRAYQKQRKLPPITTYAANEPAF